MKWPWRRQPDEQVIDLTTPQAVREYNELLRLEREAMPRTVVDFSRQPAYEQSPERPRWRDLPYDHPSRLGFLVVREQRPVAKGPSGLPDIVD
ncbi:hypothetical protein [Streptomyces sp. NPDC048340]|uniref:hypothetical protein n=1 Tax=Streptomyces sp. NPDC048340 TaxID=3365537 RepID=UPI00371721D4